VLTSCNILTGVNDVAFSEDGGLPPPAASDAGGDVVTDGPGFDAGKPVDGAPRPKGFCESLVPAPRLCVTFDNVLQTAGVKTATDFEELVLKEAGTGNIDTNEATSPPGSALFAMPTSNGDHSAYLRRIFAETVPSRIELTTSFRIDAPDATRLNLHEIRFGVPQTGAIFVNVTTNGVVRITHADNTKSPSVFTNIPTTGIVVSGTWMRMRWVLEASPPAITVDLDGVTIAKAPLPSIPGTGAMTFLAGCTSVAAPSPSRIWFDDYVAQF
jgi:hypothetical protein